MFTEHNDIRSLDQAGSFLDVKQPWEVICRHLLENTRKTILIRGKPRTGKTTLGKAAEAGKVDDVLKAYGFKKVVYCSMSTDGINTLVKSENEPTLTMLAKVYEESKVIVFFDEAQRAFRARQNSLEFSVVDVFIKQGTGYAVFATTGSVRDLEVENTTTLDELVSSQFFYRRPTSRQAIATWLMERIAWWEGVANTVEFLMDISDGDIGFLQFIGTQLEGYMKSLKKDGLSFSDVREVVAKGMRNNQFMLKCRHFGLYNAGSEDEGVQRIVRQLLCCGNLQHVDPTEKAVRAALTGGFAALNVDTDDSTTLLPLNKPGTPPLGFTHPLQHELYKVRINNAPDSSDWGHLKDESEFVNISFEASILSFVCSWLPQLSLVDTISNIRWGKLDPPDVLFQFAFKHHLAHVATVVQEVEPTEAGNGYLYFEVTTQNKKFGVELLVRTDQVFSSDYIMTTNKRKSFEEHFRGGPVADGEKPAYTVRAESCDGGYCTLLLGSAQDPQATKKEVASFKAMIEALQKDNDSALKYHIILAIASRGWGTFTIVAWSPAEEGGTVLEFSLRRNGVPHYFDTKSQRPLPARKFDPSAGSRRNKRKQEEDDEKEYYVHLDNSTQQAFLVAVPTNKKQDIAHLQKAIHSAISAKYPSLIVSDITILNRKSINHDPNDTKPSAAPPEQPLQPNESRNPYLFQLATK